MSHQAIKLEIQTMYDKHLAPMLDKLAWAVYAAIRTRRITVLEPISEPGAEYKYGAYAVSEAWSDLDEILKPHFHHKSFLTSVEYIELIDIFVDDLKEKKLLYMEW